MNAEITIGYQAGEQPVVFDIEELLATRLLVQGNSGSGKSHLLRRLLEESAGMVQQVVVDPEGDFTSLADAFDHVVIDSAAYSPPEIEALARRCREHRASVVLALEGLEVEQQIRCAAQFLNALFDAPREHWFPALVVVDEAQMFAPSVAGEIGEDTRRMTLSAMTNLMCRGRKRGLAGIVATQRLAKLAKNVAAEASNFLMGRTFLDIDMQRAADLLGMERKQAERIRDLERGHFLALGPAISRRPVAVKIGPVRTGHKARAEGLMPLPAAPTQGMEALLTGDLAADVQVTAPPPPPPRPVPHPEQLVPDRAPAPAVASADPEHQAERTASLDAILGSLAREDGSTFQSASRLYQAFLTRARTEGFLGVPMDMGEFRRRFAIASVDLDRFADCDRQRLMALVEGVDDDIVAPYLAIAAAAMDGLPAPDDNELARVYGTSSPGRIRRLLDHLEKLGLIVVREEFGGGRSLLVPGVEPQSAN
ncbi:ATP-binding protein [Parerythrobacter aestuarii]|uniref:ATP-binding protein n=1 Tax=Parerythrobacter aestuarii TaxID=3020909 RepID=UPI0024DE7F0F|nr:ATP-binding protein [Parerythrobacter aestuarii]